jgi:hypothetical protein
MIWSKFNSLRKMFIAYLMVLQGLFDFSFVHKFRLREKPMNESKTGEPKAYECLCIGNQNLGTVRLIKKFIDEVSFCLF